MEFEFLKIITLIYWFVTGTVIGSFLGVLIDRIPLGESVLYGRSHCDFCKKKLRWFELIPVFSFLFQKGKCLRCKKKLSWRYPMYELVTGCFFALLWWVTGFSVLPFLAACVVASSLLVIVIIDLDQMIIPDVLVITTAIGALAYHFFIEKNIVHLIQNYIVTGIGAYLAFYILWRLTKKKGLGFGDVNLAGALGILLGFPYVILGLYLAFLTGGVIGIILILKGKKKMKSAIPFGPFLVLGTVLAFFVPMHLLTQYFVW